MGKGVLLKITWLGREDAHYVSRYLVGATGRFVVDTDGERPIKRKDGSRRGRFVALDGRWTFFHWVFAVKVKP